MHKIIPNILIIVAALLFQAVYVSASPEYSVSDDMIIKYNGNADVVTVPAVIDGVEIAGIDTGAFQNKDMHTVIIEEGIEVIQPNAFEGCKNLRYVKSPESMLLINENAFFECHLWMDLDASEKTYIMNEMGAMMLAEVESEEYNGFLYSGNTITGYVGEDTDITIPDSINGETITTIGDSAFTDNVTITSVVIPDTVTNIGSYAFKGCTALAAVSLPKQLSYAGTDTFMNCTSLANVTVPGSLKRIPRNMFYGCSTLTDVVLEEGIENTGDYAFYNCHILKSISVPSTLKSVSTWSFGYCYVLEGFEIPKGVTSIGSATFYGCKKISSIVMPDTVTSMGTHAFRGCSGVVNMKLSENLNRISYRALNGCGFSTIEIPQNVIYIDDESFYQCQKLTSIEVPDGVITMGTKTFYGCFRMTECIVYSEDVAFGTDVFWYVADGCKIWVPENSATLTSAEEKGITYCLIKEYASVAEQEVYVNGELVLADADIAIQNGDTISVKYRLITADDTDHDLFFAFLRYDEEKMFLGFEQPKVSILKNSQKMLEESFEVTDEYRIKAILFDSAPGLKALCPAPSFKSE